MPKVDPVTLNQTLVCLSRPAPEATGRDLKVTSRSLQVSLSCGTESKYRPCACRRSHSYILAHEIQLLVVVYSLSHSVCDTYLPMMAYYTIQIGGIH